MPSPALRPLPAGTDPRLRPFLEATTEADAGRALARLMEEAAPVMSALLQRKQRGSNRGGADAEDVVSEARTQLAVHLQRLRADPADRPPIADFRAYAATVAFTAWAAGLRVRHPGRATLLNQLRYLLENRTGQRGFALWTGPGGEPLAGFDAWRGPGVVAPAPLPERHQLLRADPRAAAAGAFRAAVCKGGESSLPLAQRVAGLLSWLGGPLPLRELTDALAELCGAPSRPESSPMENAGIDDPLTPSPADPRPSPHDELRWKEYLLWLWREVARLTLRQRSAFLFHSNCLREMELLGLAGVRQAAVMLELPPERMAEYWNVLPLEDRAIASLLGLECQQVVNLRKGARGHLGRAWREWLDGK